MSAGWIFTKPPKGKPPGFSARWATMSGMSLALAPSSSKVMGIPREWKKRHRCSMPCGRWPPGPQSSSHSRRPARRTGPTGRDHGAARTPSRRAGSPQDPRRGRSRRRRTAHARSGGWPVLLPAHAAGVVVGQHPCPHQVRPGGVVIGIGNGPWGPRPARSSAGASHSRSVSPHVGECW